MSSERHTEKHSTLNVHTRQEKKMKQNNQKNKLKEEDDEGNKYNNTHRIRHQLESKE